MKDDETSLVVLESHQLSTARGGVDRSDFERYGQAIGEDIGGLFGFKNSGREAGRDIGGLLWDNRRTPTVQGGAGGVIGGSYDNRRAPMAGGIFGALFGFGLGRR